jgi:hypothetical protein
MVTCVIDIQGSNLLSDMNTFVNQRWDDYRTNFAQKLLVDYIRVEHVNDHP